MSAIPCFAALHVAPLRAQSVRAHSSNGWPAILYVYLGAGHAYGLRVVRSAIGVERLRSMTRRRRASCVWPTGLDYSSWIAYVLTRKNHIGLAIGSDLFEPKSHIAWRYILARELCFDYIYKINSSASWVACSWHYSCGPSDQRRNIPEFCCSPAGVPSCKQNVGSPMQTVRIAILVIIHFQFFIWK